MSLPRLPLDPRPEVSAIGLPTTLGLLALAGVVVWSVVGAVLSAVSP